MDPLNKIFLLNERILAGETLNDDTRAELKAAVSALREQRAKTLAESEAKVVKFNRTSKILPKTDSYRPVEVHIGDCKLRISDHESGDELAERLAACWNFCCDVPMEQLTVVSYQLNDILGDYPQASPLKKDGGSR
jgi:hypothetical protein